VDVVGQRLQRRHIEHPGFIGQRRASALLDEQIDRAQEGRERLAGTGRCRDQHIPARLDGGPRSELRRSGRIESTPEPGGNGRMEGVENVRHETQVTIRLIFNATDESV